MVIAQKSHIQTAPSSPTASIHCLCQARLSARAAGLDVLLGNITIISSEKMKQQKSGPTSLLSPRLSMALRPSIMSKCSFSNFIALVVGILKKIPLLTTSGGPVWDLFAFQTEFQATVFSQLPFLSSCGKCKLTAEIF